MLAEFSQEEMVIRWEEFLAEFEYEAKVVAIADRYPEVRSLEIPFDHIDRYDTDLAIHVLERPNTALYAVQEAVRAIIPPTYETMDIIVRVKGLPKDSQVEIRDLRSEHLGKFQAVRGLVRKVTEVRPRLVEAQFRCLRCDVVLKEPQEGPSFREPLECYKDQGGCGRASASTKFSLLTENSAFVDTQKIEIQEAPEGLRGGEQPQRLQAYLVDDLTGTISPGDRVILNGTLRIRQRGKPGAKSTLFDIELDVNSIEREQVEFEEIEITEADLEEIEAAAADPDIIRRITASIAPSLYGLDVEKEALALQLFGGVRKLMPDDRRIRGDIHVLLVGDPGTGKSELLSYMSRLSPRGVYATGLATTAAGLTAAAVRDEFGEGRWTLEAGALVLADKGHAMIDEIDKMNPQDRSSIHEAMEQQRISIAKAGITATLQSRCAVLAAANPRFGRFDENKYIAEQIDLPPALLSRFDLIFSMVDKPESGRDSRMADHMLRGHLLGEMLMQEEAGEMEVDASLQEVYLPYFPPEFLRKYVAHAKRIYPVLTPEAMEVIHKKYLEIRRTGEAAGSAVPITPRQLEAFVRLTEAGARARLSLQATAEDAERAVRIVEYWLARVAGGEAGFDIDIITTGVSHSQREQILALRDIISEVADEDGVASVEDVKEQAESRGITAAQVDDWLRRWRTAGEIYAPAKGKVKLVTRT